MKDKTKDRASAWSRYAKPEAGIRPRLGGMGHLIPGGKQQDFEAAVSRIWDTMLRRFNKPLRIQEWDIGHVVTVLGHFRFIKLALSGMVGLEVRRELNGWHQFVDANISFGIDLPLKPVPLLFEEWLREWDDLLAPFTGSARELDRLRFALALRIRKAMLRAIAWRRFRRAVRAALRLDPETLTISRHMTIHITARCVTAYGYNDVIDKQEMLRRIWRAQPGLIWLFELASSERRELLEGLESLESRETLGAFRELVLADLGLPPAAWRFLANGRARDFRVVLDWIGPHGSQLGRWAELREWLKVLLAVGRPLSLPVQRLFLHDAYQASDDGTTIRFRNVRWPAQTMACLIAEAERHQAAGTLRPFVAGELGDVLAWMDATGAVLDANQRRAGWRHLVRRAAAWKHEEAVRTLGEDMRWPSLIGEHDSLGMTVRPLDDVWRVHREALGMRNCANTLVPGCLAGSLRLFSFYNAAGKQVATVALTRREHYWKVLDVRGFANARVPASVEKVAYVLAGRYTDVWRLAGGAAQIQDDALVGSEPQQEGPVGADETGAD